MLSKSRKQQLDRIERFEGDRGKMPDAFSDMTLQQLVKRNEEITKTMKALISDVEFLSSFKKKGWRS